jgi:phosphoglycerol transferase MdoB-like AlkP superfamily enzyme
MITGCYALSVSSYFKHALTGDYVYPWDLIHNTGNLNELAGFVNVKFPVEYILYLVGGIVILGILLSLRPSIRLKRIPRIVIAGLLVILTLFGIRSPEKISETLNRFDMSVVATSNQQNNHLVNGFTGAFIVNLYSMKTTEPEDYSKEKIAEIMGEYKERKSESFSSPDIIVILSESFWNPKLLPNVKFSMNPIPNFEGISARENAVSGYMYQTAFGGGTVRTEFEVLTGLSSDYIPVGAVPWQYVNEEIPTFASVYHDLGYRTVFLHTFGSAFYLRNKTYQKLGFDEMYFLKDLEKIEGIEAKVRGNFISDDCFMEYVKYILEKQKDTPNFVFGITMENHQPYEGKYAETVIDIANPDMSDESIYATRNYTTGVYYSDKSLGKLVEYIDKREKETVLIYFGDHLPNLGQNKGAYTESGFIEKAEMADGDWEKLMRTPFLIYGNFEFGNSDLLKAGINNSISSYNLLNAASELISAPKTSYMGFLTAYGNAIPYFNNRLKIKTDENQNEFINKHKLLTYDILNGEKFSVEK